MKESPKNQPIDPIEIYAELRRRHIMHKTIAKRLNRSKGAVTHAINGKSPKLLARMKRYLDRTAKKQPA
jgi:hypothetical protein